MILIVGIKKQLGYVVVVEIDQGTAGIALVVACP